MRAQKLIDLIRYEGRKRPEIGAMLARAADLSDEEIAAAKVPLPWFRNGLKEARRIGQQDRLRASVTEWAEFGVSPEQTGLLAYWNGADCEVRTDRDVVITVTTGEPLFFPTAGGVWIDTLYSKTIDPRLTPGGVSCSRNHYREVHRDWVTSRHA